MIVFILLVILGIIVIMAMATGVGFIGGIVGSILTPKGPAKIRKVRVARNLR